MLSPLAPEGNESATTPSTPRLPHLPIELLDMIMNLVGPVELFYLRQASREMSAIVQNFIFRHTPKRVRASPAKAMKIDCFRCCGIP